MSVHEVLWLFVHEAPLLFVHELLWLPVFRNMIQAVDITQVPDRRFAKGTRRLIEQGDRLARRFGAPVKLAQLVIDHADSFTAGGDREGIVRVAVTLCASAFEDELIDEAHSVRSLTGHSHVHFER